MTTLPRIETTQRLLSAEATPAMRVAYEAAQGLVTAWCEAARSDRASAAATIGALRERLRTDTAGVIALTIRRAVWAAWDDARDAHPDDRGAYVLSDGAPAGVLDVCRAAAIVAASVAGLVEPADDQAEVIAAWWVETCGTARRSVPLGTEYRNGLQAMLRRMPRWPGAPLPFQVRLADLAAGAA